MNFAEVRPQIEELGVFETPHIDMPPEFDFSQRIEVRGKFLFLGEKKFWVKGVTYGTFQPGENGDKSKLQTSLIYFSKKEDNCNSNRQRKKDSYYN